MNTKTLSNLVLEFPALEKSKGKALKGGSGPGYWDTRTGQWVEFGWWNGGQSTMLPGVTVTPYSSSPAGGTSPYPNNPNSGGGGNNSGGGGSGGGGGFPYPDLREQASLAYDHAGAWQDFYVVGQRAFDGTMKTDMRSIYNEIVERPNFKELFSGLQGEGIFKGLAVIDRVGKVLGVVGAIESGFNLYNDIKDGHLDKPALFVDAAVSIGSLFLKSNIVGFAVSGGWMLIKGEIEDH